LLAKGGKRDRSKGKGHSGWKANVTKAELRTQRKAGGKRGEVLGERKRSISVPPVEKKRRQPSGRLSNAGGAWIGQTEGGSGGKEELVTGGGREKRVRGSF